VAGKIELHSRLTAPTGHLTKITEVDERYGWVLAQHLYDERGQLIASAKSSQHRYYAQHGVTLPQHVEIQLAPGQPNQMAFNLDVGEYRINNLSGDPTQLWTIPRPEGFPLLDMADPNFQPLAQAPPAINFQQPYSPYGDSRMNYRPRYRRVYR
jgi:hypothetical protein